MHNYSLGPEPKFTVLAELAKTNRKVWRKVAKLCQGWHYISGGPKMSFYHAGETAATMRAEYLECLRDYHLPENIKQVIRMTLK